MKLLRTYGFSLTLIFSILAGLLLGKFYPEIARNLRPLGDLFLNLIFMVIVPLVFFTLSSAISSSVTPGKLSPLSWAMTGVFLMTSIVAAATSLAFMLIVSPTPGTGIIMTSLPLEPVPSLLTQAVKALTVSDFPELISRKSMLPLIVFSVTVGLATLSRKEKGAPFAAFLASGAQVFARTVEYIMYLAPVGLMAWFAATVVDTGDKLATAYVSVFFSYYSFAVSYFFLGFTLYAYMAGRLPAITSFWKQMLNPSLTAVGTCSSMATMPINLEAAPRMGVPPEVCALVIPVGAALHKDGSVIGGVLKILFAMSLFHRELTIHSMLMTVGVAVLVGVVVGAIPSGGMIGEMLILSLFGFPPETLPLLAVISVIIDPLATLLNATGDNVAAMMVARITNGNLWRVTPEQNSRQEFQG